MDIDRFLSLPIDLTRSILVFLRLIPHPDLIAKIAEEYPNPDAIITGKIILVQNGKLQKWAVLRCPGGCGEKIQLSLNSMRNPSWVVHLDRLNRPSIHPSIRKHR